MRESGGRFREAIRTRFPNADAVGHVAVLVPLVTIALSESALYYDRLGLALWGHFLTFLGSIVAPLVVDEHPVIEAFALISLFRLVNLGLPVFFEQTLYVLPVVYLLMLPAIYVLLSQGRAAAIRETRRHVALGFLPAIGLGWILAEVEYTILQPEALIPTLGIGQVAVLTIVMVPLVGVVEEVMYRGILQPPLQDRLGRWPGIFVTAGLYGVMHAVYGIPAEIAFGVGVGVALGVLYDRAESITLVALVHGSLNVFLFGVIPILRSGPTA